MKKGGKEKGEIKKRKKKITIDNLLKRLK